MKKQRLRDNQQKVEVNKEKFVKSHLTAKPSGLGIESACFLAPIEKIFSGRALVVEDEELIRELLVELLEDLGLDVDQAENGQIALDKIKDTDLRYVLTDLKMPVLGGEEVIKQGKKITKSAAKFIILSGGVRMGNEMSSTFEMADAIIDKPFSKQKLVDILKRVNSQAVKSPMPQFLQKQS